MNKRGIEVDKAQCASSERNVFSLFSKALSFSTVALVALLFITMPAALLSLTNSTQEPPKRSPDTERTASPLPMRTYTVEYQKPQIRTISSVSSPSPKVPISSNRLFETSTHTLSPKSAASIIAWGENATQWRQGDYEVWWLQGGVTLQQNDIVANGHEAILWIQYPKVNSDGVFVAGTVNAYLENGNSPVTISSPHFQEHHPQWFGRLTSDYTISVKSNRQLSLPPRPPAIYSRADRAWKKSTGLVVASADSKATSTNNMVKQAQWGSANPNQSINQITPPNRYQPPEQQAFSPQQPQYQPQQLVNNSPALGVPVLGQNVVPATIPSPLKINISSRNSVPFQQQSFQDPNGSGQIYIAEPGVNIVIEGNPQLGTLDISTDRLVIWSNHTLQLEGNRQHQQDDDLAIELYMEGNIIFRQGERVIYAERLYYNVQENRGIFLDADMLTPVDSYQGLVRFKADVLQQLDKESFQAHGAAFTTSRLGIPRYWFQSETIFFQDIQEPVFEAFPLTGGMAPQKPKRKTLATSRNNFVYLAGAPVFYWPFFATDLQKPTFYLDRAHIKNDSTFGTQVFLKWDLYQLAGIQPIEGTKWTVSTDYLHDRGAAFGTNFGYEFDQFLGFPGHTKGDLDFWGVHDSGLDNLGNGRIDMTPEEEYRYRLHWQHRQTLANDIQFSAEAGLLSDRNFLEQYFEGEWDTNKDYTTGFELKKYSGQHSLSLEADFRPNDFFTQTEWLPRGQHSLLGQSWLFDRATWNTHSSVGYARLQTASAPLDPQDAADFDPLAWESNSSGMVASTRHEISLPTEVGAVKVTPYLLGEAFYVQQDLIQDQQTRLLGQTGIRASLPFWKVDPTVQSTLWNLNGLAHKGAITAEFAVAESDRSLDLFPLYNPLDDDTTEHFRRRFFFNTFGGLPGGNVPLEFDERFYALRSGIQSNVTLPNTEIADDLMFLKLGLEQRWQTKRGTLENPHVVDWITLNMDGILYPNPARDNFGQELGMLNYDMTWQVGDRVQILSDGYLDLFADGLRTFSLGANITRPAVSNFYIGYRSIEGPISSNILGMSVDYRISEKWIASAGTSFDFGPTGSIGQNLGLTYIGESMLFRLGTNFDSSRDDYGLQFSIEPRFALRHQLGVLGGVPIPPAGAFGIE